MQLLNLIVIFAAMPTSLRPTGHQSLQKTSKSEKDESEASGATIKKQRGKKRQR